ncbi:MAG: aldehyde ferredoxin oxidoreductase [Candidatus Thorarchaeota archaeon]|nr:MAG: aldehyde ferredoxin oxidoreductase [Candidatus Thorarchaeota archaeon]
MRGYAGKFLDVNLSTGEIRETKFADRVLRDFVGGRGLATKILWDRLGKRWETVDPLGPENILLMLTGPLTGYFPGTKICVSGKSPQCNGVVGSTVAGEFGVDLKCAGYDGLIISGRAEKPCYMTVFDDQVEIKDASSIWGKQGRETVRYLTRKSVDEVKVRHPGYGEAKEPSMLYIGPAGEHATRVAVVLTKYAHAAGYGGYGGVMGSKNLKAVVAKGFGPLPEVDDPESMAAMYKTMSAPAYERETFRRWGTGNGGYYFGAGTSSEPIRNWQEEWHDIEDYSGDEFDKFWAKKYWGDFGCPVTCLKLAVLRSGKYEGAICDNPDYELQSYDGTNLGVFDPEVNIHLASVVNEMGLCGIQGGAVLGLAAELYQRGVLTRDDLEGIELEWGNPEAFEALMNLVVNRKGIGDILAQGVYRAAKRIEEMKGVGLMQYVVHEKGMAIGAHGIRSEKDFISDLIGYACSTQGGDHGSQAHFPPFGQGGELSAILHDSAVYCMFAKSVDNEEVFRFYTAITGWKLTAEDWYNKKALRILQIQRAMLLLGGPDITWKPKIDDDNPPRFWEPMPSGPFKGKALDRKTFEKTRAKYYRAVGWDKDGVPTPETLKSLGLSSVNSKLNAAGLRD